MQIIKDTSFVGVVDNQPNNWADMRIPGCCYQEYPYDIINDIKDTVVFQANSADYGCLTISRNAISSAEERFFIDELVKNLTIDNPPLLNFNDHVVYSSGAKEFIAEHDLHNEVETILGLLKSNFLCDQISVEELPDYETDFTQLCFTVELKITYRALVRLKKQFYKKLSHLTISRSKLQYIAFDFEREEP